MHKLAFLFSILLVVPAFANTKVSELEKYLAELDRKNEEQDAREKAKQRMNFGMGLIALSAGSLVVAGGWGLLCGFAASIEHMHPLDFLKCFTPIGVPALAVAATSGYFGTKMRLGGAFGLLKNPLEMKQGIK